MTSAEASLAAHKPLAQWAVEGVLLSSELVPHLRCRSRRTAQRPLWAEGNPRGSALLPSPLSLRRAYRAKKA